VSPKHHPVRIAFVLFAVLGLLAVFVLDGAAAAAAAFGALLVFIFACMGALRSQDAATRRNADRTGLAGWFGGWF
jgi:hypothetical protein